jgi:hypothetical protein
MTSLTFSPHVNNLSSLQKKPIQEGLAFKRRAINSVTETEAESTSFTSTSPLALASTRRLSPSTQTVAQTVIQAKLIVGSPGDKYEQEADEMAEKVMRMPDSMLSSGGTVVNPVHPLAIQRMVAEEDEERLQRQALDEEEDETLVQTKAVPGQVTEVSPSLEARIHSQRGKGQPLRETNRSFMESRFGRDFSGVRVHTSGEAIQLNRELGAQAFTHGRDVYFGAGRYRPESGEGKRLLAHELTHVVQQGHLKSGKQKGSTQYPLISSKGLKHDIQRQHTYHNERMGTISVKWADWDDILCDNLLRSMQSHPAFAELKVDLSDINLRNLFNEEIDRFKVTDVYQEKSRTLSENSILKLSVEVGYKSDTKAITSCAISFPGMVKTQQAEVSILEGEVSHKHKDKPPSIAEIEEDIKKQAHEKAYRIRIDRSIGDGWRQVRELDAETLASATVNQRLKMLAQLSKAYWTGGEEEEAIIRILSTTPHSQASTFVKRLTNEKIEDESYLTVLDQVADFGNNLELHEELSKLRIKSLGPEEGVKALETAPILIWHDVIGFSETRAVFKASRTKEGKVRIEYSKGWEVLTSKDFGEEPKNLGEEKLIRGFTVNPNQVLIIHDYDRGTYVPFVAQELIGYEHAKIRSLLGNVATFATLPLGGGWALAKTLLPRILVAAGEALNLLSILVDENRLNIVRWFPKWGSKMIYYFDMVNIGVTAFGLSKFLLGGGMRLIKKWKSIRKTRVKATVGEAEKIANLIETHADNFFDQVEEWGRGTLDKRRQKTSGNIDSSSAPRRIVGAASSKKLVLGNYASNTSRAGKIIKRSRADVENIVEKVFKKADLDCYDFRVSIVGKQEVERLIGKGQGENVLAHYTLGKGGDPRKVTIKREHIVQETKQGEEVYMIRLSEEILDSDEAIVAAVTHEFHELRKLEEVLIKFPEIRGDKALEYIKRFHDEALDEMDKPVKLMREYGWSPEDLAFESS